MLFKQMVCSRTRIAVVGLVFVLMSFPNYAQEWKYTVRPGDTLWYLAEIHTGNLMYVSQLQELNDIENPKRLVPGSTLRIPVKWLKVQPVPVEVIHVHGAVTVQRTDSSETLDIEIGDKLAVGDLVTTGNDSNVVFRFADGSQLILRQDSHLTFDTLSQFGDSGMIDTRVRLQHGRAEMDVQKRKGEANRYEIHTPSASTAVRGTQYRVNADKMHSSTKTTVQEGSVDVTNAGIKRNVPQGFGVVTVKGKPPKAVVALLPAPDISQLPKVIERLPIKLDWKELDGASYYRFELAENEEFSSLLIDEQVSSAGISGVSIAQDGSYNMRTRGVDKDGLEGINAQHSFMLNAYPAPPYSVQPKPGQVLRDDQTQFKWLKPDGVVAYQLQLSTSDQFESLLLNTEITNDDQFKLAESLQAGSYFWRIASRDQSGELGPYSDVQTFTYKPLPASPKAVPPTIEDGKISMHWPLAEDGTRYRLQVSKSKDFSNTVVDEILDGSEYTMDVPKSGDHYIRVASIGEDGVEGEFGSVQHLEVPMEMGTWTKIALSVGFLLALL